MLSTEKTQPADGISFAATVAHPLCKILTAGEWFSKVEQWELPYP